MDAHIANAIKSRAPLRASRALRTALRERGRSVGSITYFYSSKCDRDIVFATELQFGCGVLLEADEDVQGYEIDADVIKTRLDSMGYVGAMPDAVVTRWTGRPLFLQIREFGHRRNKSTLFDAEERTRSAERVQADWAHFSNKSFEERSRLFHDWMHIAPVLAQNRVVLAIQWDSLKDEVLLACKEPVTLGDLRAREIASWSLIFSAAFKLVQTGVLSTDLCLTPLSSATKIYIRADQHAK